MRFLFTLLVMLTCSDAFAAWPVVPPWDPASAKPDDFADHELEVPYHLFHFHTVANAVTETGNDRGFLNIAVNREPKDNKPYNARIQEMNVALAYFYTQERPWNPYYRSEAVKVRLEAMLDFWCNRQAPDGLFSEYGPDNFSLAPTGFGARHMAATLEMLHESGVPFDEQILARTYVAQRKAIMALLTDKRCHQWGREYSNQISGVYKAAAAYLRIRPDAEMQSALNAFLSIDRSFQSPTGFMYEQGGPDFGYTSVHLSNVRLAWPYRDTAGFGEHLAQQDARWSHWLSYNLLLQPNSEEFIVNAGINTRTSHWLQTPSPRPWSQFVEITRCFSTTDESAKAQVAERRAKLQRDWGKWGALKVPNAYSYLPSKLEEAQRPLDNWHPTREQKQAAIAELPHLKSDRFIHQAHDDSRPYLYTYVRQPGYYAIFNSGKVRIANRQYYGLGLLWNPQAGTVLQSVAGTEFGWGTVSESGEFYERKDFNATVMSGGALVEPQAGHRELPLGPLEISYPLGNNGAKSIAFEPAAVTVRISHPGDFTEQLPLLKPSGTTVQQQPGKVTTAVNGKTLVIEFAPSTEVEIKPAVNAGSALERVMLHLRASDQLTYTLSFTD